MHIKFLYYTFSLRTKLKLKTYIKIYFTSNFVPQYKCLSIFLLIFIDKYDLYRNNYRFLINVYLIIATFIFKERTRRFNVFSFCYLKNMSQQQKNATMKSQRTILNCRFCYVSANEHHNFDYDMIKYVRLRHQIMQIQRNLNDMIKTKNTRYCRI